MKFLTIVEAADEAKELKGGEFVREAEYTDEQGAAFAEAAQAWCVYVVDDVDYEHDDYGSRSSCTKRHVELLPEEYLIQDGVLVGCVIADTAMYFDGNKNQDAKKTYTCQGISRLETGYGLMTFRLQKKDSE